MKLKKSLSLVLALTLLLSCLGITASAETDFSGWTVITETTTISENGNYYLNNDVTGDITVNSGVEATLDLNGHVLKGTGNGSVITSSGNLTLQDSNPKATHDDTTLPAGGVVTGGSRVSGGGVYITSGEFTMTGGTISGNIANSHGGGVHIQLGKFTMTGGTISGNTAGEMGGGVCVDYLTAFTMTGGTISGNTASNGGGGLLSSSNVTVGGTAKIDGNTALGVGSNLAVNSPFALGDGTTVAEPTNGMNVGVTLYDSSGYVIAGKFTSNGTKEYEAYFFSDNTAYADKYNDEDEDEGYLELVTGYTVTENTCTNGTISVGNQASAYEEEKVTVTTTPDDGYKLDTLTATYNDGTTDRNLEITNNSFTMPAYAVTVSASFSEIKTSGEDIDLDLEDSTTAIPESTTIDQYYTKVETTSTTVNYLVNITWSGYNLGIEINDAKIWDWQSLSWVKDNDNYGKASLVEGTNVSTFTLKNYSPEALTCKFSFAAADGMDGKYAGITFKNGDTDVSTSGVTLAAIENDKTKIDETNEAYLTNGQVDLSKVPAVTVTNTITPNLEGFANAADVTPTLYGTYTLTISKADN